MDHVDGEVPEAIVVTTGDGMPERKKVVRLENSLQHSGVVMVVDVVEPPNRRLSWVGNSQRGKDVFENTGEGGVNFES